MSAINRKTIATMVSGLHRLNIIVQPWQQANLIKYMELLEKWSRVYNLTAPARPEDMVLRHLLDSLAITKLIVGPRILDFGSGAGLPGLPLAMILPEYQFTLLDSSTKKSIFLRHVKLVLALSNVTVVNSRVEQWHTADLFNTVVTRATYSVARVLSLVRSHLAETGQLLVMKGKLPRAELAGVKNSFVIKRIMVPYLEEERHVVRVLV